MMRERRVELRCFARMPRERNSHHANGPMLATTGHRDAFRQVARRDCAAIARLKATHHHRAIVQWTLRSGRLEGNDGSRWSLFARSP